MSDLRRFFVSKIEEPLTIDGEEFRHAVNVLRIKEGEEIIVCDGSGYEYVCMVDEILKKQLCLSVLEKRLCETEAKTEVTLIAGYLKGDKTELVVQKAVELGVKNIVVFDSEYSSAYMSENKLLRLNKVAVEASKQCGRAVVPKVEYANGFNQALEFGLNAKNKLFACEFAKSSDIELFELSGSTAIVVGSEGGFSVKESELAEEMGYKKIFLGKRILRAETASIALLGIIMYSLKELK
ncbi:MAG: 16S rRNA (uracil(1498)-N(3))-methyltransferase [Clostridia bacterium]|nr:16S rRNA (uracil(1498)-N(3))-methyltransferase [Clostridia bacterium]